MRLLRLLRPYLWFLIVLRLLGLLPWYLGFLHLPSLRFQLSLLFESEPAGSIQVVPLEDDQALDDLEANHNVWNDLLQLQWEVP